MNHQFDVSAAVEEQMAEYFNHLSARITKFATTLPPDKLWLNPFPFGNSVGHLIVHLTGSSIANFNSRCDFHVLQRCLELCQPGTTDL